MLFRLLRVTSQNAYKFRSLPETNKLIRFSRDSIRDKEYFALRERDLKDNSQGTTLYIKIMVQSTDTVTKVLSC